MTKYEKHMLKARMKEKMAAIIMYAVTIPVGAVIGAFVFVFMALAFLAALWPLWLSGAAVAIVGHFIGWW